MCAVPCIKGSFSHSLSLSLSLSVRCLDMTEILFNHISYKIIGTNDGRKLFLTGPVYMQSNPGLCCFLMSQRHLFTWHAHLHNGAY